MGAWQQVAGVPAARLCLGQPWLRGRLADPPLPDFRSPGPAAFTSVAAYHPPSWVDFSPPKAGAFQLSKKLKKKKQTEATAHFLRAQEFLWGPQVEQPRLGGLALPAPTV